MNVGEDVLAAAQALDAQRPAEAAARLTKALGATNDPLEVETLLSLRSYASWLVGDWTDMPALIADFGLLGSCGSNAREVLPGRTCWPR